MEGTSVVIGLVIGLVVGAVAAVLAMVGRLQAVRAQAEAVGRERDEARNQAQTASAERERVAVELASVRASLDALQARQASLEAERDQALGRERQARDQAEAAAARAAGEAARASKAEEDLRRQREELESLRTEFLTLQSNFKSLEAGMAERERSLREQIAEFERIRERWTQEFGNLAQEALGKNAELFLKLANENLQKPVQQVSELVKPVKESLEKLERTNREMEKSQTEAQAKLSEQLETLTRQNQLLQKEANSLTKALKAPQQKGKWGELQLRKVVELAGMTEHCDFKTQVKMPDGTRPDMVIEMPNKRRVAVDSKVVLNAYWEAFETEDETVRAERLKAHARNVQQKIVDLSNKRYWEQLQSVDFVVLFMPNEPMLGAALEQDPSLTELAIEKKVLLATPMTLVSLLHAVAFGWQQQKLSENAAKIGKLGKELYERIAKMGEHFEKLGKSLKGAVENYNAAVGSLERRVLPTARELQKETVGDHKDTISVLDSVESPRALTAPEFVASDSGNGSFNDSDGGGTP